MRPFRRLISTITTRSLKQQNIVAACSQFRRQHNENRPAAASTFLSKRPTLLSTTSFFKRIAYYPLNSIIGLVSRALFQHSGRDNNALLATTSIGRALRYSIGTTPSREQTTISLDVMPNKAQTTPDIDADVDEDKNDGVSSKMGMDNDGIAAFEDHKLGNNLDSLRAAYAKSRKEASNIWLDFASKSCYIYLYRGGGEPNQSLSAFDLDGTLIKPRSNKRFPRNATDWELFSVWTKSKLQQCLRETQSRFVIFTNQNGVGLEIVPLEEVQHRIELVTKRLDIPCTVFVAVEQDIFRKPRTGMFQLFNTSFNDSVQVNFSNSFYCGDAIGYPSHSDADIKFAKQLGFPFITPEKFLRGVKPKLVS